MSLISAEQAKRNADAFDLSREQVLEKVAQSINANSKSGKREVVIKFLQSAVSDDELNYVKVKLKAQGFKVVDLTPQVKSDSHALKIKW